MFTDILFSYHIVQQHSTLEEMGDLVREMRAEVGQGIIDQFTGKTGQKIFNELTNQATFDQ